MTERDVLDFSDSERTCQVVLRADGILEPFWTPNDFGIDDSGALGLLIDRETNPEVVAVFPAGEWRAVGEMRLADGFEMTQSDGRVIKHESWEDMVKSVQVDESDPEEL